MTEWSSLDDELDEILKERLAKCNTRDVEGRLSVLTTVVYDKCKEKLGVIETKSQKIIEKRPNRRQVEKGKLRSRQRNLKKLLRDASEEEKPGLQDLLDDTRKRILTLSRAENLRKKQKRKRKARDAFYRNPFKFAKALLLRAKV